MRKESDIKYQNGPFFVLAVGRKGFEVYREGPTTAVRVACIGDGPPPFLGLTRAIAVCDDRAELWGWDREQA